MKSYLSRTGAAKYLEDFGLPVSPKTLAKWATTGGGPIYRRFGNRAVYNPDDLDSWAQSKLSEPRTSTSCA